MIEINTQNQIVEGTIPMGMGREYITHQPTLKRWWKIAMVIIQKDVEIRNYQRITYEISKR